MSYIKSITPKNEKELPAFVDRELSNVQHAIKDLTDQTAITNGAPDKPRNSLIRYADGVNWNPGNGAGLYQYDGTGWNKLSNENPNIIINGGFDFWQRGTSLAAASSLRYLADRWLTTATGSTIAPSQQPFTIGQTAVTGNPVYFHRCVVATSAGASNFAGLATRIEDVTKLSGKTVTLSFFAKADASKNIAVEFIQNFGTGGSPSSEVTTIGVTTCNLTSSWNLFTLTTTLPSVSSKTLGTFGNSFTQVMFWLDAGSSFNSRTNSLGQQSGTFDFALVKVEEGSAATPMPLLVFEEELSKCQRYYEKSYNTKVNPGAVTNEGATYNYTDGLSSATHTVLLNCSFKVTKRATPTVVAYSNVTGSSGVLRDLTTGADLTITGATIGASGFRVWGTQGSSQTSFDGQVHWTADAEL